MAKGLAGASASVGEANATSIADGTVTAAAEKFDGGDLGAAGCEEEGRAEGDACAEV